MPNRSPQKSKLNILRATHLSKFPWLVHGFSTRQGGFSRAYGNRDLNLGFTKEDSKAAVERNRAAFLHEVGALSDERKKVPRTASRKADSQRRPLVTLL